MSDEEESEIYESVSHFIVEGKVQPAGSLEGIKCQACNRPLNEHTKEELKLCVAKDRAEHK